MEKKSKIWVIFINPTDQTIERKQIDHDWDLMKSMIDTRIIEALRILDYPTTYVLCDEEGRLKGEDYQKFTKMTLGYENVYEGNLMLVGASRDEFDDCLLSLEQVKEAVEFMGDDYIDPPLDIQITSW